jgi:hypothetical protein
MLRLHYLSEQVSLKEKFPSFYEPKYKLPKYQIPTITSIVSQKNPVHDIPP